MSRFRSAITVCIVTLLGGCLVSNAAFAQDTQPAAETRDGFFGRLCQGVFTTGFWGKVWILVIVPLLLLLLVFLLRRAALRKIKDVDKQYFARKLIARVTVGVLVVYFGFVLLAGAHAGNIATIVGLLGAGLAVALQDIISSFVAWFFIIGPRGFDVGDRIRIGSVKGDVVDVGILRSVVLAVRDVGEVEGQATGALRVFPNNMVFKQPLENFTVGNEYVWHEIDFTITYESNWRKAERIILSAVNVIDTERIASEARGKMESMRRNFQVRVGALTPIVYVEVADSGVVLTLRYLCGVREVRGTGDRITREVLVRFSDTPDVALAYPTMRIVPTPVKKNEESS